MNSSPSLGVFLVQAGVVIFGWYVVHRLAVARDMDKARREMVAKAADSLVENMTELLADIRDYHRLDRSASLELKIKSSLQDASMRIVGLNEVSDCRDAISRCNRSLGGVRTASTMRHFEDEHLGALKEDDPLFQDVAASISRVKQDLLRLKYSQFPRKRGNNK